MTWLNNYLPNVIRYTHVQKKWFLQNWIINLSQWLLIIIRNNKFWVQDINVSLFILKKGQINNFKIWNFSPPTTTTTVLMLFPLCNFLEFMIFRGVVLKELHADFFAYILGYFTPDKQFRVLICTKECRAHQYSHFRSASPHFVCWRTSKATETRTNLFYVETNPPKKYTTNFIMT